MKIMKKSLAMLLALLTVLSAMLILPVSVHADDSADLIKGTFSMVTFDDTDPGEQEYFYSDSYFSASGKELNPHLRTMSAALTFTTKGTSSTPDETYGRILASIGFTDIVTYDMDHTAMDTLGVVIARKEIGEKDVIAVLLRGDGYGAEMAANLIAGSEGDIQAFADAETLVESRVGAYLDAHGITAAKYWVAGFSRSGAVANLFGRALNNNTDKFGTTADDIYVYTFEAPISAGDDTAFENIHNIIDRRDLVNYVYPAVWPQYNSGTAEYIGSTDDMIMLKTFSLFSATYMEDLKEVKLVDFLTDFFRFLGTNISREIFSEKLQTPVSQTLEIYYTIGTAQQKALIAYAQEVAAAVKQDQTLIATLLSAVASPTDEASVDGVTNLIIRNMDQVAEASGKPVSDSAYDTIKSAVRPVVEVALPIISQDLTAKYDSGDGTAPVSAPLYHVLTFFGNLDTLISYHLNYRIFNELKALDSYYQKQEDVLRGDVDGDGKVDIFDASSIQKSISGAEGYEKYGSLSPDALAFRIADVDSDGKVDIFDASLIQKYIAGELTAQAYHIGEAIAS